MNHQIPNLFLEKEKPKLPITHLTERNTKQGKLKHVDYDAHATRLPRLRKGVIGFTEQDEKVFGEGLSIEQLQLLGYTPADADFTKTLHNVQLPLGYIEPKRPKTVLSSPFPRPKTSLVEEYSLATTPSRPASPASSTDSPIYFAKCPLLMMDGKVWKHSPTYLTFLDRYKTDDMLTVLDLIGEHLRTYNIHVAMLDVAAVFEIGLKLPFHFEYYKHCFPDYKGISKVMMIVGQRYRGYKGARFAALTIQSTYRMHHVKMQMKLTFARIKVNKIINKYWRQTLQRRQTAAIALNVYRKVYEPKAKQLTTDLMGRLDNVFKSKRCYIILCSRHYSSTVHLGRLRELRDPNVSLILVVSKYGSQEKSIFEYLFNLMLDNRSSDEISRIHIVQPSLYKKYPFMSDMAQGLYCSMEVVQFIKKYLQQHQTTGILVADNLHESVIKCSALLEVPIFSLAAQPDLPFTVTQTLITPEGANLHSTHQDSPLENEKINTDIFKPFGIHLSVFYLNGTGKIMSCCEKLFDFQGHAQAVLNPPRSASFLEIEAFMTPFITDYAKKTYIGGWATFELQQKQKTNEWVLTNIYPWLTATILRAQLSESILECQIQKDGTLASIYDKIPCPLSHFQAVVHSDLNAANNRLLNEAKTFGIQRTALYLYKMRHSGLDAAVRHCTLGLLKSRQGFDLKNKLGTVYPLNDAMDNDTFSLLVIGLDWTMTLQTCFEAFLSMNFILKPANDVYDSNFKELTRILLKGLTSGQPIKSITQIYDECQRAAFSMSEHELEIWRSRNNIQKQDKNPGRPVIAMDPISVQVASIPIPSIQSLQVDPGFKIIKAYPKYDKDEFAASAPRIPNKKILDTLAQIEANIVIDVAKNEEILARQERLIDQFIEVASRNDYYETIKQVWDKNFEYGTQVDTKFDKYIKMSEETMNMAEERKKAIKNAREAFKKAQASFIRSLQNNPLDIA